MLKTVTMNPDDLLKSDGELQQLEIGILADNGYAATIDGVSVIRTASNTQIGAIVNAMLALWGLSVSDHATSHQIIYAWNEMAAAHLRQEGQAVNIERVKLVMF